MMGGSRRRQVGWVMALGIVFTLFVALTFRVHAVKSEVVRAERQIIALKQETMRLETEFETRANQQQLANWNAVDFGYVAPSAGQYLENERQLASLAQPAAPGAPDPIRVARAPRVEDLPGMVSPITGRPVETLPGSYDPEQSEPRERRTSGDERPSLAERLGMTAEIASNAPGLGSSAKVAE